MKHHLPFYLLAALLALRAPRAQAQPAESAPPAAGAAAEAVEKMLLPGKTVAEAVTEVTGVAISPLLGMSVVGAWTYYWAEDHMRARLPWYCHPYVWGTGLVLIGLCFLKDFLGTAAPPLVKKPLDFAELFEDKISALVASTAFVPLVALALSTMQPLPDQALAAPAAPGLAMTPSLAWLEWGLRTPWVTIPVAVAAFLIVWLSSHAVNVLIALSPFGIVDSALKLFKLALFTLVFAITAVSAWAGIAFCLLLILLAMLVAGWSFRLSVFGALMGRDFLLNKHATAGEIDDGVKGFLSRSTAGVPARTYGRMENDAGGSAVFAYRPWLILPEKRILLPAEGRVLCKGVLHPGLLHRDAPDAAEKTRLRGCLILLPRYRGLEESIAARHGCQEIVDSALLRGFKAVRHWFVEMLALGRPRERLA